MKIYRLLGLSVLFFMLVLALGTIGCSDDDGDNQDEELAGELICDDGIDNDGDGDTDCDDIDCILDPACAEGDDDDDDVVEPEDICNDGIDNDADGDTDCDDTDCILFPNCIPASCDDFLNANCQRFEDCELSTFEDCILAFELIGLVCENVESTATQECINDIDETSCDDVEMGVTPESCVETQEILGVCDECEVDEDCPVGLFCFPCFDNCTGVVSRCTSLVLFAECTDGIFRTQE